jgi:hypothetical protein
MYHQAGENEDLSCNCRTTFLSLNMERMFLIFCESAVRVESRAGAFPWEMIGGFSKVAGDEAAHERKEK